jgi:hypothetical protein
LVLTTFQTKTSLKHSNELVEVAITLVLLDKILQLLGVNNQVEATDLRKTEFLLGNASLVDLLQTLTLLALRAHSTAAW